MPPSLDQDNTNTSNHTPQLNKSTQKASSAGVQIPTKNGRKNGTAKDNGDCGVVAAVTKNASKMSNNRSSNLPCRFQGSEVKPVASASNGNPVTSPLLNALSAAPTPSASQNTTEWAKNVPAFSSSPNNLIQLGESPPTLPSSYEDRLAHFGWTTREQRGIPLQNGYSTSTSPPNRRRPTSYHLDGNYSHGADDHHSQVSSYAARRSSMYSQYSRYGPQPPLPHQAQAHFYGAPDVNLLLSHTAPGLVPGDNGYYCGFDSLPISSQDSPKTVDNVVVAGYDRGLDVYAVSRRGLNRIVRIDGLRGGVYNAKILSWNLRGSNSQHFPLIAVVVHGAVWTSSDASSGEFPVPPSEGISATQPESVRGPSRVHTPSTHENDTSTEYYQTTVEVYSLSTKEHVATLLSLPKTHVTIPTTSPLFRAPAPVGSLSILADSGNLVIASGTTGETWMFRQEGADTALPTFKCVGKVWTTVQHGLTVDSTDLHGLADGDWRHSDPPSRRQQYKAPIISLNGRWLAYCPSTPSSQISLRAAVPIVSPTARIPGLNGQAPPQLPPVNCLVETPGGESMMKQLAQAATQEVIKGAAYLGKQGVQAWNNYWNKSPPHQPTNGGMQYQTHQNMAHQFPPTHGVPNQAPPINKDPGLISIIDLDSLVQHNSFTGGLPHPLATFKVPHGCSFLSFAPSGLALFTASSKGDVQFVWDLMRIQYSKSSFLKGGGQGSETHGPHVRQIAYFSRMTIARIVDVAWTSPHGERAAMVTEPGTVHILDLPASAFTWPPPRRKVPSRKPDEDTGGSPLSAAGVASNAVNSLWTAARPLVSRRRRSSTGISALSAASVSSQAGHGTHALAAGISRSVGAATGRMNEMRKSGSPKLHLPRSAVTPSRACIRLLNGKRSDSVLVVASGIVGLYTVKSRRADRPADKQKASRGAKYVEFRLPYLPDFNIAPEDIHEAAQGVDLEFIERDLDPLSTRFGRSKPPTARPQGVESSIPQAEIESNAPYQPFHTDRRVSLHVYSHEEAPISSPSVSALLSPTGARDDIPSRLVTKSKIPWSFGGEIKSVKLDVGPAQDTEDSFYAPSDHRALPSSAIERIMRVTDHTNDMDQIVVTTRLRKSGRSGSGNAGDDDEEGFFEDDCEVLDFASQRV